LHFENILWFNGRGNYDKGGKKMILLCAGNSLGVTDVITMFAVAATAIATIALAKYTKRIIESNQAMIGEQKLSRESQDHALRRDRELQTILALYHDWKNEMSALRYGHQEGPEAIGAFLSQLNNAILNTIRTGGQKYSKAPFLMRLSPYCSAKEYFFNGYVIQACRT
jgi:hypothetical protein